jgi:ABC-type transport system involved in cytochrome bd biosynthesis fused ATPase/permease subunit
MFRSRAEDRRTMSCWRLAVASPHSAISAMVRPQPVQTLALASSAHIFVQGEGGLGRSLTIASHLRCQCFEPVAAFENEQLLRVQRADLFVAVERRLPTSDQVTLMLTGVIVEL